jgi:hypothetical protein
MLTYDVEPLQGIGPVRLGMTRAESRAAMALPVDAYRKGESPILTDAYLDSTFQVFFDEADRVEFIELSSGGPCVPLYREVRVLDLAADEAIALVAQEAQPIDENGDATSVVFPAIELSLWRPFAPYGSGDEIFDSDEDWGSEGFEPIEPGPGGSPPEGSTFATVGIGRRGYFSSAAGTRGPA